TAMQQTAETLKNPPAASAGPAKPADAPPAAQPPAASAKLDYRQEETLKNARFYLKEIEPRAKRVFELTAGTLNAQTIPEALDHMQFIHGRMASTVAALNALPANHPEVAAESKRY